MVPGIRAFLKEAAKDIQDGPAGAAQSPEQYLEALEPETAPISAAERRGATPLEENEAQGQQMIRLMALVNARHSDAWALAILFGLFLSMLAVIFFSVTREIGERVICSVVGCAGVVLMGLGIKRTLPASRTAEIMEILTQTEDPRLAPYIIDLMFDDLKARREALLRVLPKLSVRDAQRLRSQHWQSLHNQLALNDAPLIIAVLEVIERCGSIGSLPFVAPLAEGRLSAKKNARIRELAQTCHTKLQARMDGQSAPHILLRGSAAPAADTANTLLRATMESVPTAPQQLLRAPAENKKAENEKPA